MLEKSQRNFNLQLIDTISIPLQPQTKQTSQFILRWWQIRSSGWTTVCG